MKWTVSAPFEEIRQIVAPQRQPNADGIIQLYCPICRTGGNTYIQVNDKDIATTILNVGCFCDDNEAFFTAMKLEKYDKTAPLI